MKVMIPMLNMRHRKKLLTAFTSLLATLTFGQFTQGNVVVLQAGDGSTTLSSAAAPIVLKEFNSAGLPTYSVAIPSSTVTGNSLVMSGSASSEGLVTRSANNQFLVLSGYVSSTGTSTIASTTSTVASRGIATVNASGTYTRVASSASFYSGNNIRGAASDGVGNFWGAGANQGTNYFGAVSTPTLIQNTVANSRAISIFNNQLYTSTSSSTPGAGIYSVGSGIPTSSVTASLVFSTGTGSSPYQFSFDPTTTICYVADDRGGITGGGVQKWTYSGSAWTLAYTFTTSITTTVGSRGLAVDFSGTNPVIYTTTSENAANKLVSIVDGGSLTSSTLTILATASANTIYRGVALSPVSCISPSVSAISSTAPICADQDLILQVNATGTAPLSYTWVGTGSFSSVSVSSPTVTNASSGNYTVSVSNACGTATAVASATVNPLPVITVNSPTICAGSTATLTASGADTYTWSTIQFTPSITVNPSTTTSYSLAGTTLEGCHSNSITVTTVYVGSAPVISVNSATMCTGSTATLTASGVNTYTWVSPASNNATVNVSPSSTSTYTVSGESSSCTGIATATTMVTVNTLPVVSIASSPTICAGQTTTLTGSGASTYLWTGGATSSTLAIAPSATAHYTLTGTSTGSCSSTATVVVNVNPLPVVSIASSPTICAGQTTTLTGSGASTYVWTGGATTSTLAIAPSATANYTLTGTSTGSCSSTATVMVTVNPLPTVSANATSSVVCSGSSVTLTGTGATTYTWTNGVVNGTAFSPTTTSTYSVTGSNSLTGCKNTSTITVSVIVCTGINESLSHEGSLMVYPNPNNGNFTLTSSVFPATLIMYDVTGKQVFSQSIDSFETVIQVPDLVNGIYQLRLTTAERASVYNVVFYK